MARIKGARPIDPLEVRCRELASSKGIDPDSRIAKPGERSDRGMPAWCQFREEARALLQKEQDKVASEAERTLVLVRAEAVENRQHVHVRRHLESAGFHILSSRRLAEVDPEAGIFLNAINGNKGVALVVAKDNAVAAWLSLIPQIESASGDHLPPDSLYGSPSTDVTEFEIGLLFERYRKSPAVTDQDAEYANGELVTFLEADEGTLKQIYTCMGVGNVVGAVLCGDAHVGFAQPVGAAVAYRNMASVNGTGFDIACGMGAVKTNIPFGAVKDRVGALLKDVSKKVSFGLASVGKAAFDHPLLEDVDAWKDADVEIIDGKDMRQLAQRQFLSCGTSNHFVDFFVELPDEETLKNDPTALDRQPVWIGVHFGSRGFGFKTATKYLRLVGARDTMFGPPALVRTDTELGQRYIKAMELSGRYAYANREAVLDTIRRILGARQVDMVHCHHNYSFLEEHNGEKLWVVRKGSTPAFPGQRGFVGGSMGDDAVIIEGVDSEKSRAAFYSTIHGAGRVMSRTQAKKSFTRHEMMEWLHRRGITLMGGGVDESPMAYKRLDEVLKQHDGTIKVNHRLRPFAVMMAGDDERKRDPYHE